MCPKLILVSLASHTLFQVSVQFPQGSEKGLLCLSREKSTCKPSSVVTTCGGLVKGTISASCMILDKSNHRWDESRMGNLTTPREASAVHEIKLRSYIFNNAVLFSLG